MPQNIDTFNIMVTAILSRLYASFPVELTVTSNDFELLTLPDDTVLNWDQHSSEFLRLSQNFNYTSKFLLHEGYIRGEMLEGQTVIRYCTLTTKGLLALQKVPKTLKSNKKTVGEQMKDLTVNAFKDTSKEMLSALVKSALSSI